MNKIQNIDAMNNTIVMYNNTLNFNLKQEMNNVNDMLFNIQNLKQLQNNINQVQEVKNKVQMQVNMASLALLRTYILDEGYVGVTLFRNLIENFYPLNNEQLLKYECVFDHHQYNITNMEVLKRKGPGFVCNGQSYRLRPYQSSSCLSKPHENILREISSKHELEMYLAKEERTAKTGALYFWDDFYKLNRHINFSDDNTLFELERREINSLILNKYIIWNWEVVKKIKELSKNVIWIFLLENEAFIAQMGINTIENTIKELQAITGIELTEDEKARILTKYSTMGIKLYSYVPSLPKAFILEHQNELDWNILIRNPYIQWDLELINILLKQSLNKISETDWDTFLSTPSHSIYQAIEPLLNDELLEDIEKLYDI